MGKSTRIGQAESWGPAARSGSLAGALEPAGGEKDLASVIRSLNWENLVSEVRVHQTATTFSPLSPRSGSHSKQASEEAHALRPV
jgi:hypothetical protein